MVFSVSNDGTDRSLDFEPGPITLNVNDLVQERTLKDLEPIIVPETRLFQRRYSGSSNYAKPAGDKGDEG